MLFYVENARVDCQFALVNGGSQFPLVAGLSNPIKFKSPSIPLGVRRLFFYIKFIQSLRAPMGCDDGTEHPIQHLRSQVSEKTPSPLVMYADNYV